MYTLIYNVIEVQKILRCQETKQPIEFQQTYFIRHYHLLFSHELLFKKTSLVHVQFRGFLA